MKKCEEYQEMISAYSDGELTDTETSTLFYHLGECSNCRAFMKSVMQLRSALKEIELSTQVSSPAMQSIWESKVSVMYSIAAVVVLAVLLSGFFLFNKVTEPPKIVERVETQYVYMTSFPPVYVYANSSSDIKTN